MGVIPAATVKAIEERLSEAKVDAAFDLHEGFKDLRQNDLPALDKKTLASLSADDGALRSFVAGAFSPSLTVQRMARRYLGRLGDRASGELRRQLLESARPARLPRRGPGRGGRAGERGAAARRSTGISRAS